MDTEIRVGPPVITISQGRTFMVTTRAGEIRTGSDEGVYALDTRFVSFYRLYINHVPLEVINASQLTFYAARYHLTNPKINTEGGIIEAQTLSITIDRLVDEGIHEEFEIINYSGHKVIFVFELSLRSDFSDLFEVKNHNIVQRGQTETAWDKHHSRLRTTYDNKDFHRAAVYEITAIPRQTAHGYANGRLFFQVELEQNASWQMCADLVLEHGQHEKRPRSETCKFGKSNASSSQAAGGQQKAKPASLDERQARWMDRVTAVVTSDHNLTRTYSQAILDMGALRIYDMDVSDEAWVPAAGVPWFVTLFGRDSLITSYQNMLVSPDFARGALKRLAEHQALERDDWLDAQPGKILHEMRFGELAHFRQIPFYPFYATADATILYLIVLSETYRWTGDVNLLKEYQQVAENCLKWIDQYGDLDGDGFQEYKCFSKYFYENTSWKDAFDSVVYADGSQVKQPKGLCELQGYVYDAKTRMAEAFQVLEDEQRAKELLSQAETLKQRFNDVFWMEDEGCYAYGLDPDKKQITSIVSNPGHCLWSGISDQEKARRTASRLLAEDMWSGWGIRTLSSKNPAYDPLAYQRGSIWPHDNGIIAAGFKRYGLVNEANQVIRAMLDAIEHFEANRPPEVFAGLARRGKVDFPVLYPGGANIPQAWATGSVFMMVQTMLGLRADAPNKRLYVNPTLPDWLQDVEVQHLQVGACSIDLHFWREGNESHWGVRQVKADQGAKKEDLIQVVAEPEYHGI
jgi:glycogen debranching enzyme